MVLVFRVAVATPYSVTVLRMRDDEHPRMAPVWCLSQVPLAISLPDDAYLGILLVLSSHTCMAVHKY